MKPIVTAIRLDDAGFSDPKIAAGASNFGMQSGPEAVLATTPRKRSGVVRSLDGCLRRGISKRPER